MADTPSVRIVKQFAYRGSTRHFSNRYHFNGGVPADNAHWETLFDAIVLAEKAVYDPDVTIIEGIGYGPGSDLPIHAKTYATVGTGSFFAAVAQAGDVAALVRYSTTARSIKNHPVYLFNYYHGAKGNGAGTNDDLNPAQAAALAAYADDWLAGFSDGTITAVRAGPHGATATSRLVEGLLTHRDFVH